ncbi:stage V sporulation protein B [Halobacillus campisalis]|uniref:Stage V sporulation protein B n=1 Tax=Halobacillus campisalis TaxID=435909 RepID=A0ABW2K2M1_9BACI|nr:stage V sporulation protein B [Halobacillus campisalis]
MSKQTFLHGALILVAAGLVTRLLGFINRILVARIMGEEGMGLYMMALPTLILVSTITQFGLPVAISKRVSEAEALGDEKQIKRILIVSLTITGSLSIIFTAGLFLFAPVLAQYLFTDVRALAPLLAVTPIIPITAVSAVLRGYFQGRQNMKPQAISQVIEQVVRIATVAFLTNLFMPYGVQYAAAGAMIAVIIGEFVSLLYMSKQFSLHKTFKLRKAWRKQIKQGKATLRQLMTIALPTSGSRLIGSLTYFFEPILVAQSLAIAGFTAIETTKLYGGLTGYILPLLFLPTFLTHALAVSLVPSISESAAKHQYESIHYRILQAIRLSLASGGLITVIYFLFPAATLAIVYGTDQGGFLLQFMAPFFLLHYIQTPLQASLQALDLAKAAMWNTLIGAAVKFIVLVALSSRPEFGINGVAIAMVTGVVIVTLLHLSVLVKSTGFVFPIFMTVKFFCILVVTASFGMFIHEQNFMSSDALIEMLLVGGILTFLYLLLLFKFKLLTKEEWNLIPWNKIMKKR